MTMTATRPAPPESTPPSGRGPIGRTGLLAIVILVAVLVAGGVTALAVLTSNKAVDTPIAHATPLPTISNGVSASAGAAASAKPVTSPFTTPATITKGITATVTKLESVQGEANTPGEIAGPAIRITIAITNDTAASIPLQGVVVNAYYGADRTPGLPLDGPGGASLTGSIAAGQTSSGTYIFTIPLNQRDKVSVELSYSADTPIVAFTGAAPR